MSDWKGNGMPPVGTECEITIGGFWTKCRVMAYAKHGGKDAVLVCAIANGLDCQMYGLIVDAVEFRPIKTEEEKAIEDMLSIVQSHYRETVSSIPDETMNDENWKSYLAALYENGYRKT